MEPRRNLFTIGQASEYLGVSIDTLRRWEKKGRIEAFRSPGGHRYYERDDLDKLFGKKYVHDDKSIEKEDVIEKVIPPIPSQPIDTIPIPPPRIIAIPEKNPIQIVRKIENQELTPKETFSDTQEKSQMSHQSHPLISPQPQLIETETPPLVQPVSHHNNFLVPQLSPLKEPVKDEQNQYTKRSGTKETMTRIIVVSILILVIALAIILAIILFRSSQSILSPSP